MNITVANRYQLRNLGRINVIVGKNGCGKSTLLRAVEQDFRGRNEAGHILYLSPERSGTLADDPGMDRNIGSNRDWLPNNRRKNIVPNFRQQSVAQFRRLEIAVLREIEGNAEARADHDFNFDVYVNRLNGLLDNVEIIRTENGFEIRHKGEGGVLSSEVISSGEAELISLAIECLMFSKGSEDGKTNILFFDSPDVHLHPDLQGRFMQFLVNLVNDKPFDVVIATHSTAILGGLDGYDGTRVAFMRSGDTILEFTSIGDSQRMVLPIFGG